MSTVVQFEERQTACGKRLGIARLDSEKSLNALSLAMIQQLQPQLDEWAGDPEIACVWLEGAGEKAFCAGGDIVAMYKAMRDQPGVLVDEVADFFSQEYRLDHCIHCYPKPLVIWGDGIVMGGGMGLMNGGSHRIVTERSLLAMPEITIGLYPDVGATHFLNQMPEGCGLFLGLTGAQINACDALFLKLADHFIASSSRDKILDALADIQWGETPSLNQQKVSDVLAKCSEADSKHRPAGQVEPNHNLIKELTAGDELVPVVDAITSLDTDDKWLSRASKTLANGCPMTAHIVWNQLHLGKDLNLADCFRLELTLSVKCATRGDFAEGIRALLIDKDKQPKWQHDSVADVEAEEVDEFFTSPWAEDEHPLADLGH
ncbi:enoyl-CoA hydratase/isomerase family protein [Pseudidiomarina terrestris]|uniref:enoyl-CoA hydratase/isomerase family protein n=1 Tax=Pseudidiomarina terrestris TaxID=2820060 RepID=UPI00264B4733|nr:MULTISPECIES: enoyl-CoA hydratase/isomerase family protein [unclassified Pseudidiomarina]MDN7134997.1 enoyl-CoA hydratase/isomerase family protein [Pseudidiomarina sp. 1ASP75-5]MDN7137668.1 enoyl-CoA hydratase/isomerase family protein [Pseudidiomarina sp. 1ASP75-14]